MQQDQLQDGAWVQLGQVCSGNTSVLSTFFSDFGLASHLG